MLKEEIRNAINSQIQAEMYSSHLYLQMSAWLESHDLKGMAHWMDIQAKEETIHAMKFYRYLLDRGGEVALLQLDAPPPQWDGPLAIFQASLGHEQMITGRINDLMDLAIEHRDHATSSVLQWFVDEQVEEESNAEENVRLLEMSRDNPQAQFMVDQQMAARPEPTPPAP